MGRFDQLTQLEKKPVLPPPLAEATTAPDQFASKPANQQTDKEANQQESKTVNQQTSKPTSQQTDKPAKKQTSKKLKKFTSYLSEESLKSLKRIAFETDQKDYEVLQDAIDVYLQRQR